MRRALVVLACLAASAAAFAEVRKFGEPLRDSTKVTALTEVLAKAEDGATVRVAGTIDKVCQNKGCWLELKDGDASVHVTFAGYAFFVPKDSAGAKCTLEGKVLIKTPDPETVEHLTSEGAGAAAARELSIEATGVEIEMPEGKEAPQTRPASKG